MNLFNRTDKTNHLGDLPEKYRELFESYQGFTLKASDINLNEMVERKINTFDELYRLINSRGDVEYKFLNHSWGRNGIFGRRQMHRLFIQTEILKSKTASLVDKIISDAGVRELSKKLPENERYLGGTDSHGTGSLKINPEGLRFSSRELDQCEARYMVNGPEYIITSNNLKLSTSYSSPGGHHPSELGLAMMWFIQQKANKIAGREYSGKQIVNLNLLNVSG